MNAAVPAADPAAPVTAGTVLGLRRVYIFPTRYGHTFLLALAVMLLGAINYDNSLAYVLTFLLGSLWLLAILHTWRNVFGLRYAGGRAEPVFAGTDARFEICFDNRGAPERPGFAVSPWRRRRLFQRRAPAPRVSVDILSDALVTLDVAVKASRRGRLPLGRLTIATTFPLGLMRAWAYVDGGVDCIVYPAPRGRLPLPEAAPDDDERELGGGPGVDDFLGFRAYRPGDPARSIAWKAVARGQPLLVKRFAGQGGRALWLDWAGTAAAGDAEARLSQLARWVLDAEAAGYAYGLRLPGASVPRGAGPAHLDACLRQLALYGE